MNRRHFLTSSAAAALPSLAADSNSFSFVLLGDLHYDKLNHHDMAWLDKRHAGDLSQIKNYTRVTADLTPRLFDTVRKSVTEARADFVLQVGDLVEGLCGTEELSVRQNREALAFVEGANLGVPFVFTKGNHDVTGDGAVDAFKEVFHPFLTAQIQGFKNKSKLDRACYTIEHGDALFCFFDAYDAASLDWLKAALVKRTARHCFVVIHPPVVPYGARSTWNLFSSDNDKAKRDKLLSLLGEQNAFVLGGHIHKFNTLCRETPNKGRFVQFAISSVINSATTRPSTELDGLKDYNGDQISVEPNHSPDTAKQRRAVYATEAPFVKAFSYADLPGHAVVSVDGNNVQATMFAGITREVYRTVDLTKLMAS
jgi:UDP-2,3-diacylglucosamine pyrophosphatase LpxH